MKLKEGVTIEGTKKAILAAAINIEHLFQKRGVDMVITSGFAKAMGHSRGDAIDLRSNTVNDPAVLRDEIAEYLGPKYKIVLESGDPHFHLERLIEDNGNKY